MRCRSTVPNGAAWARSAAVSPPSTARFAANRSSRNRKSTAISNIIFLISAMACRFPDLARGHEQHRLIESAFMHLLAWPHPVAGRKHRFGGGRLREPFHIGLCGGRECREGSGKLAQSMDGHGSRLDQGKKGCRKGRFRFCDRMGEGGRAARQGIDFPGDKRTRSLERSRNPLRKSDEWREDMV